MNRTLLAAVLTLGSLFAVSAYAQVADQSTPRHMHHAHNPHKQAIRMSKRLGLNPDQTAKLEPILAQRKDQLTAIRQNTSLTTDQRRAQIHDLKRNIQQQLAGVLTPEEMQQLKAMHRQNRMHGQQTTPAPTGV